VNLRGSVSIPADFTNELRRRATAARNYREGFTRAAVVLRDRAREHSRGRPGPNLITGQFHDAWTYAVGGDEAVVSNGSVYANRLEWGFVGVDSIGRHYNQPPYPSLGPAVARSGDLLAEEIAKVIFR
jgi:hypothetical protein